MDFILQPNIYGTSRKTNLMSLLEKIWINDLRERNLQGKGTLFILSGFSNFNGGVRFYNYIQSHIQKGGACKVILGGSSSQNLSSQQVVRKLLEIGCNVGVINRKAIFHAKCYGYQNEEYKTLIVSSGNFTSRGLTQNIEASVIIENEDFSMNFDWYNLFRGIEGQKLDYYIATLDTNNPVWDILYDEDRGKSVEQQSLKQTMLMTLSHSDTARIQAERGTNAAKGTQYFWLSKDSYDFFPPLDLRNNRGVKNAYQTLIEMNYVDLNINSEVRVTFEAENNFDFRLGTGELKYTKVANEGDMVAITRNDFKSYEMRIFKKDTNLFDSLLPYATNFIGNQGKRYGYIANDKFMKFL